MMPGGRRSAVRCLLSRLLRPGRAAGIVLLGWMLLLPLPALAGPIGVCTLQPDSPTTQQGQPGESISFTFTVVDGGTGTCNAAAPPLSGSIFVSSDTGDSSASLPPASTTWTAAFGESVTFDVNLGPMEGDAVITVNCPGCVTALPPLQFATMTRIALPDYVLTKVSPPDGTVGLAGDTIALVLRLEEGGAPAPDTSVEWHIIVNPNNSVFGAPDPGTTLTTQLSAAGEATIDLVIGQPNPVPADIHVSATVFSGGGAGTGHGVSGTEQSVTYVISARDVLGLQASNPSSNNQQVRLGEPMQFPFEVRALRNGTTDTLGPQVDWTVSPAGAATLSATSVTADSGGIASVTAVAGNVPGPFTITATHADDPAQTISFNALAKQYSIEKPSADSGDGQSGAPGTALPLPLRALVLVNGVPAEDIELVWSVTTGTATLTGANPGFSGSDGIVEMPVTLGASEGVVHIRAALADDPSFFTDFTATIGILREIGKPSGNSGDGQSAPISSPVPEPLKALVTNDGVPVAGVSVLWEVTSGSASFSQNPTVSDADGIAGVSVTFGATAGPVTISAMRADDAVAKTSYTLQATSGAVLSLVKPVTGSGDGQSGFIGDTLAQPLVVIANNDGTPTAGVTIHWTVNSGDADLGSDTSVTDTNGRASVPVTLGATPGSISITATRADAPLATSNFVLTAREPVTPVFSLDKPENSGDGSSAAPGASIDLVARVLRNQIPIAFERVGWEIVSGDAAARPSLSTSESGGLARTRIELGESTGAVVVRAYLVDYPDASPILFNLASVIAGGETLSIVSGDAQSGPPGTTLAPLVVAYANAGGPIADAPVTWELIDGQASLSETATKTDANGRSQIGVTLGASAGPVHIRASAGSSSVVFALAVTDDGLSLRIVGGDEQRGPIGTVADLPLLVEVLDGGGHPRAGQPLQWEILIGEGTLDTTQTTTDDDGRSSVVLTFSTTPAPVAVLAYLPGQRDNGVTFSLDAFLPGLHIVSGDGQSGTAGTPLAQDFVVELFVPAARSKALNGVRIDWQVLEGDGTLDTVSTLTDADGRARTRLTLGPSAGLNRVSASIGNGDPVIFGAHAEAAGDNTIEIVSGNGQTLPTQAPSAALVVLVRDAAGAPLADVDVHWSGDNAELDTAASTSGSDGRTSTVARVVLPGTATITASLDNGDSVDFVINGGVGNIGGLDQTEQGIADAIDIFCPELFAATDLTAAQLDLRARCMEFVDNAGTDPDGVRTALDALRQDVAMGQSNAAYAAVGAQFDNLKTRIAALRAGSSGLDLGGLAVATGSGVLPLSLLPAQDDGSGGGSVDSGGTEIGGEFSRWGFFASGQIGRGSQDGDSATPEYDFDSAGLTAGVDYRVNDRVIVGASVGWNRQQTDLARDRGGIETRGWSLSAYSTWYRDNAWYLDGVATIGSNDYDLDRRIRYALPAAGGGVTQVDQIALASTGGDQRSLALSFGRDFQKGAWSLGPYLRGTYTRVDFDAYSERTDASLPGAGLGLAVDARELESQTAVLGGKASYAMSRDWGILMPHVQLEWEHEFQDDPDSLVARFLHDPTHTPIRTDGEALDTDYYNLGLGLSALFPGGKSAFLYYERLIGASGQSQDNLSLGVRIEF